MSHKQQYSVTERERIALGRCILQHRRARPIVSAVRRHVTPKAVFISLFELSSFCLFSAVRWVGAEANENRRWIRRERVCVWFTVTVTVLSKIYVSKMIMAVNMSIRRCFRQVKQVQTQWSLWWLWNNRAFVFTDWVSTTIWRSSVHSVLLRNVRCPQTSLETKKVNKNSSVMKIIHCRWIKWMLNLVRVGLVLGIGCLFINFINRRHISLPHLNYEHSGTILRGVKKAVDSLDVIIDKVWHISRVKCWNI